MRTCVILVGVLLAGCARPASPAVALPEFLPAATAYIDPSYPTSRAVIDSPRQTANGIEVRMDRAWRDGKNINADVCFTLPDASDWSIWAAALSSGDLVLEEYGTTLVSQQDPIDGKSGLRCDTLTFVVPPDAELSTATITIDAIAAYPREGEYCSVYMPKIQQALLERGIGITLECVNQNGSATMQIVNMPPEMTEAQAQEIVFDDEFFSVQGPWAFAFKLGP